MTTYRHTPSGLARNTRYRVDTASGSVSAAVIQSPNTDTLIAGSIVGTDLLARTVFEGSAATLYLKELGYQDVASGVVVTSVGSVVADIAAPGSGGGGSTVSADGTGAVTINGTTYNLATDAELAAESVRAAAAEATNALRSVNPADVGYDIILAAGQSNMWGQGHATNVPDPTHYDPSDDRIWQWGQSGSFTNVISLAVEPLSHPVTSGYGVPTGMGPAFVFARWYAASIAPNRKILIVPVAVGSTTIQTEWDPVAPGALYSAAITAANAAIAAAGANSRIKAILWLQGESDAIASYSSASYQTKLDLLIAGWRTGITGASASTPFIVAGMVPEFTTGTAAAIRAVHTATPSRVAYTGFAGGPAGANQGDSLHYTAAGQRVLGRNMFQEYLTALTNTLAPQIPGQVTGLGATVGNAQVALTWSAPASIGTAITDYLVEYKASASPTWLTFADGTSTTAAATVTGLTNATAYDFRVSAINIIGTGTASATTSATPTNATAPGAPTGLGATAGPGRAALAWTAPASNGGSAITDYVVQYRTTAGPGSWNTFSDGTSTSAAATVTGLTPGTGYDFQVAAVNAIGTGSYSSTASATPTTPALPLTDTFTGSSGALTAHAADSGGAWTLKAGAATMNLNGGGKLVVASSGTTPTIFYNSAVPGSADYTVAVDLVYASAVDAEVGPLARVSSSVNSYIAACPVSTGGGSFCLLQNNAGSIALIGAVVTPSGGISTSETYRLSVTVSGTTATARCQRASDSFYLTSAGAWQSGAADYRTGTTAVTATGFAGLHSAQAVANGTTIDNLSAS